MKKKIIVIGGIVCGLGALGGVFCVSQLNPPLKKNSVIERSMDVGLDAKTDSYTSVEELEEDADIIVRGIKIKENDPIITYQDGVPISGYTLSDFCVKEVLKDSEKKVKINDTISILENEFTDKKTKTTYHVAGYSMMDCENEYMLYLSANTFENGSAYYTPLAVNYGISSLGDNYEMEQYVNQNGDKVSMNEEIDDLRREIRKQK